LRKRKRQSTATLAVASAPLKKNQSALRRRLNSQ
jgi:hypothetical protein